MGGVNYADLVVTEGVVAEITGQATGEPKIVLVYVPNKNTEYKVYHHLVKGDGATISDVVDENGNPYVVTYTGKTGAFVDEATGRSYALVYDPNNPVAPGLYIKGYVFGSHTGEKLSGYHLGRWHHAPGSLLPGRASAAQLRAGHQGQRWHLQQWCLVAWR